MDWFHVASTRNIAGEFAHGRGPTAASTGLLACPSDLPSARALPTDPHPSPSSGRQGPHAAAGADPGPEEPPTYRPAEEAASGPCAGVNDGARKGHVAEQKWAIEPAGPLSCRFRRLYPQQRTWIGWGCDGVDPKQIYRVEVSDTYYVILPAGSDPRS